MRQQLVDAELVLELLATYLSDLFEEVLVNLIFNRFDGKECVLGCCELVVVLQNSFRYRVVRSQSLIDDDLWTDLNILYAFKFALKILDAMVDLIDGLSELLIAVLDWPDVFADGLLLLL